MVGTVKKYKIFIKALKIVTATVFAINTSLSSASDINNYLYDSCSRPSQQEYVLNTTKFFLKYLQEFSEQAASNSISVTQAQKKWIDLLDSFEDAEFQATTELTKNSDFQTRKYIELSTKLRSTAMQRTALELKGTTPSDLRIMRVFKEKCEQIMR